MNKCISFIIVLLCFNCILINKQVSAVNSCYLGNTYKNDYSRRPESAQCPRGQSDACLKTYNQNGDASYSCAQYFQCAYSYNNIKSICCYTDNCNNANLSAIISKKLLFSITILLAIFLASR